MIADQLVRLAKGFRSLGAFRNPIPVATSYLGLSHETSVVSMWRDGARYVVRPKTRDVSILYDLYVRGPYDRSLTPLSPGSTIIDIGGNIGAFSVLAGKRIPWAKIFTYEPFRENYELLRKNVELNGLDNVTTFLLGVGAANEKRRLVLSSDNTGAHSMYAEVGESDRTVEIETITLTEVFSRNAIEQCDLLKIDAEGAEYDILYAAPPELLGRVRNIVLEFHVIKPGGDPVGELKSFLERNGFRVTAEGEALGMMYGSRS